MNADEPHRDRRVKFTEGSTERLGKWAEHASNEDFDLVSEALFRVVEGTWREEYDYCQSATHRLTWDILVRRGLILTVRFAQEYPSMVQLIYIGQPWDTLPPSLG